MLCSTSLCDLLLPVKRLESVAQRRRIDIAAGENPECIDTLVEIEFVADYDRQFGCARHENKLGLDGRINGVEGPPLPIENAVRKGRPVPAVHPEGRSVDGTISATGCVFDTANDFNADVTMGLLDGRSQRFGFRRIQIDECFRLMVKRGLAFAASSIRRRWPRSVATA